MAAECGCRVLLIDRSPLLGGQLIKQTHKFFGSEQQRAKTRGFRIAESLVADLESFGDAIEIWREATVVGAYPDSVLTVWTMGEYRKIRFQSLILAVGAGERTLAFENNDLPGVYGAGAVQTLMNVYGVLPGKEIVMIGSGNIGLIVSYQLIQAGATVKAVVEAAQRIGGYKVHATKLRRLGVPILTRTTILRALGEGVVRGAVLSALDDAWNPIPGTEIEIGCDACAWPSA
jgi:sarcosine oxidase subunit alpha